MARQFTIFPRPRKKGKPILYVQFRDPETGKRLTAVSSHETTRGRAEDWAIERLRKGVVSSKSNMTFSHFAENWWTWGASQYIERKLEVAAGTGARMGEIQSLQVKNVHENYLEINKTWDRKYGFKEPKWGSIRNVPILRKVYSNLRYVIENSPYDEPDDLVFGGKDCKTPKDHKSILTSLYKAFEKLGISEDWMTQQLMQVEAGWLVVSDAHQGIQAAVRKCFLGSSWQRCRIHFIRNILGTVGQREKARVAAKLKQIWQQPDRGSAIRMARLFIAEFRQSHPLTVETLRQGLEDSLQFYAFEELDGRKISSTNMQERLHEEVRRRSCRKRDLTCQTNGKTIIRSDKGAEQLEGAFRTGPIDR